jgi:hypothetical protein
MDVYIERNCKSKRICNRWAFHQLEDWIRIACYTKGQCGHKSLLQTQLELSDDMRCALSLLLNSS